MSNLTQNLNKLPEVMDYCFQNGEFQYAESILDVIRYHKRELGVQNLIYTVKILTTYVPLTDVGGEQETILTFNTQASEFMNDIDPYGESRGWIFEECFNYLVNLYKSTGNNDYRYAANLLKDEASEILGYLEHVQYQ